MAPPETTPRENRLLDFFGFDTGRKTARAALWAAPYLVLLAAGLAGISALVHPLVGAPVWGYVLAEVLALVYFFLFLARLHRLAQGSDGESPDRPGS